MSHDIRKLIHRVYGIAVSAVTVVAGARIAMACYGIYQAGKDTGEQIYSRAIVAETFQGIALPVYLCLALVIGGFILHLLLPQEKQKLATQVDRQHQIRRLQAKTDMANCDPALRAAMEKEQKSRRLHCMIGTALLVLFSGVFMTYACNPARWPEVGQVTGAVVQCVFALALCLIAPTGYTIFAAYFCRRSLDKEFQLAKEAAKQAPLQPGAAVSPAHKCNLLLIARYGILVIALAFTILGYCTGGIEDVVAKAAAICTECVGLG